MWVVIDGGGVGFPLHLPLSFFEYLSSLSFSFTSFFFFFSLSSVESTLHGGDVAWDSWIGGWVSFLEVWVSWINGWVSFLVVWVAGFLCSLVWWLWFLWVGGGYFDGGVGSGLMVVVLVVLMVVAG